jgi:hypothetical protein
MPGVDPNLFGYSDIPDVYCGDCRPASQRQSAKQVPRVLHPKESLLAWSMNLAYARLFNDSAQVLENQETLFRPGSLNRRGDASFHEDEEL